MSELWTPQGNIRVGSVARYLAPRRKCSNCGWASKRIVPLRSSRLCGSCIADYAKRNPYDPAVGVAMRAHDRAERRKWKGQ